jgi:UDP-N-acetylglucosamine 2-epimerase
MNQRRPLLVIGTRPEAIKMAPIIKACRDHSQVDPIVCFTGQHRELLDQVAEYFEIVPDVDLNLMRPDQTLAALTARCLEGIDTEISRWQPDCLIAQGDTTSVLCASMAAFYRQLPFIHVEAGLRTNNLQSPWPEEFNRRVASLATTTHCAPTQTAASNLHAEGVCPEHVHVTGNTVIDALLWTVERERNNHNWKTKYDFLGDRRMVLITGHRRESFGSGFESICLAIQSLSAQFPEVEFVYPVHLNPRVREPVFRLLAGHDNVHLLAPAPYPEFVWLMDRSELIITDSGGVQEEAPSLRKPVLVTRDTTERPEALQAGVAQLVGTTQEKITATAGKLLSDASEYAKFQIDDNPYGDGNTAERIVELLLRNNGAAQRAA